MILRGSDVGFPDLGVAAGLSEPAAALDPQTLTACVGALAGPGSFGALAPATLIRPEVDISAVVTALNGQDPERLSIRTPVRIQQGTADGTVFKLFTDPLVEAYRRRGMRVSYKVYEGVDHGGPWRTRAPPATRRATSAAACAEMSRELAEAGTICAPRRITAFVLEPKGGGRTV